MAATIYAARFILSAAYISRLTLLIYTLMGDGNGIKAHKVGKM